jgi:mannose-6-phosphate isomerase-like protein (cupin superfamily)
MKQSAWTAAIATVAFFAGVAVAHGPLRGSGPEAEAASAPLPAAAVDLYAMVPDALPSPTAVFPNLRSKVLVVTDGMTLALQSGTALKHIHNDANEIQVVLQGTGTEWLGAQQVALKPGTLVVIPKGTVHGGLVANGAPLAFVSIKTPPQDPADVHFVP